jgi:drug/metabolite transporter (DMT)-like permease
MHIIGIFCAIGAGVFFGFIGPFTKIAYNLGASVGLAIILRYVVASILITPAIIKNKPTLNIYKTHLKLFLLFTSGSILLTTGLLVSVKYIPVSLAILIFCTYPIIVLIASIFFDKEEVNSNIKIVFFISFIGLFLVLGPSFQNLNLIGVSFAFIASIGASTMILTNQKMANRNIRAIHINAFTNFFNTIFFIILIGIFFEINLSISLKTWLIILIPSLCYAIAFFLQLLAIPKIGQSRTALLLYTEPVVAILSATILLNETLNMYQSLGAIIVISSLIYATYKSNKSKNAVS